MIEHRLSSISNKIGIHVHLYILQIQRDAIEEWKSGWEYSCYMVLLFFTMVKRCIGIWWIQRVWS